MSDVPAFLIIMSPFFAVVAIAVTAVILVARSQRHRAGPRP